ncbi:MAG: indole-3-glycerol phosphate synthase TrpC [Nitrospirota bacterium]
MGILHEIVAKKKERLKNQKSLLSLRDIKARIYDVAPPIDFRGAVGRSAGERIKLIAEIKRASPSRGIIRPSFDHRLIAAIYEEKNVDAVSVLTEEDFFQGSLLFVPDVKQILTKPVLRKDFILDEYQIYESRAYGADAVLFIAAILGKNQTAEFIHLAGELGLSVLFEIHDFEELGMALDTGAKIIGVNNRNLKTMRIDTLTTLRLKREIPADRTVVTESGIRTREDVLRFEEEGIDAMLIGTSLMEAADVGGKIDELTGRV